MPYWTGAAAIQGTASASGGTWLPNAGYRIIVTAAPCTNVGFEADPCYQVVERNQRHRSDGFDFRSHCRNVSEFTSFNVYIGTFSNRRVTSPLRSGLGCARYRPHWQDRLPNCNRTRPVHALDRYWRSAEPPPAAPATGVSVLFPTIFIGKPLVTVQSAAGEPRSSTI